MDKAADHARNRLILRRTLSVVSWQYAVWSGILGLLKVQLALPQGWGMVGHALLLGGAGFGLWRPRVWAWPATALAALGSIVWVAVDLRSGNLQAALVDGAYAAVALLLFASARERRLDNPASGGDNP